MKTKQLSMFAPVTTQQLTLPRASLPEVFAAFGHGRPRPLLCESCGEPMTQVELPFSRDFACTEGCGLVVEHALP